MKQYPRRISIVFQVMCERIERKKGRICLLLFCFFFSLVVLCGKLSFSTVTNSITIDWKHWDHEYESNDDNGWHNVMSHSLLADILNTIRCKKQWPTVQTCPSKKQPKIGFLMSAMDDEQIEKAFNTVPNPNTPQNCSIVLSFVHRSVKRI